MARPSRPERCGQRLTMAWASRCWVSATCPGAGGLRPGRAVQEELVASNPSDTKHRQDLANSHYHMGLLLSDISELAGRGRPTTGPGSFRRGSSPPRPATPGSSKTSRIPTTVSASCWPKPAIWPGRRVAFDHVQDIRQKLADANPGVTELQRKLAIIHYNNGILLARTSDPSGAGVPRPSDGHPAEAGRRQPRRHGVQQDLAGSHNGIGVLLSQAGDPSGRGVLRTGPGDPAEADGRQSRRHPIPEGPLDQPQQHRNPAGRGRRSGRGPRGLEQGPVHPAEAGRRQPRSRWIPGRSGDDSRQYRPPADFDGRSGRARAALGRALAIHQKLADANPDVSDYRREFVACQNDLAELLRKDHRPAEARDGYDRVLAVGEPLARDHPETTQYRATPAFSLRGRGLARLDLGDLAGAASDTRRALEIWDGLPTRTAEDWFETACCHATLAALGGREGPGIPDGRALAEADQVMALLKKSISMGYRDYDRYRTESALDGLRVRPDFRDFMLDLAFPNDPFVGGR